VSGLVELKKATDDGVAAKGDLHCWLLDNCDWI
jgi:hypothetical protein